MVLQDDDKHHSPCGTTTLDNTELFKPVAGKTSARCFYFYFKKKLSSGKQTLNCNTELVLFYSFCTVSTGAQWSLSLSALGPRGLHMHKQGVKLATWGMMFSVIKENEKIKLTQKKKKKRNFLRSKSPVSYFFPSVTRRAILLYNC